MSTESLRLRDLCCACGADAVFAVSPGAEGLLTPGAVPIARPQPPRAWCQPCWIKEYVAATAKLADVIEGNHGLD